MSDKNMVYIVESDAFICEKLGGFLDKAGLSEVCVLLSDVPETVNQDDVAAQVLDLRAESSLRLGRLASRIIRMSAHGAAIRVEIGGGYVLDQRRHVLIRPDGGGDVRLTEKESAVLVALYEADGLNVTRDTLLDKVWAYAQDVETHTLETHIYRLRQKIEIDSSTPKILMTDDDGGYYLNL